MSKHILILGTGSVGKRHARNLKALGCTISCMDPRPDRMDEIRAEGVELRSTFASVDEALSGAVSFDGVVVGSPPSFHVDQAVAALQKGLPVLLEKPVSPNLADCRRLHQVVGTAAAPLLLGYTWRWWPPLARVKELMAAKAVGNLLSVTFTMSAHLADWHPWERYQDFFMSSAALGGGALLDESHWLDLMLWFFGMPDRLFAKIEKVSDLEIETDDNVDMLIIYEASHLRISMHLDLYGRPHEKSIQFTGTGGSLIWEPNQIKIGREMDPKWEIQTFNHDRNEMFVHLAEEFLKVLAGDTEPSCKIDDGLKVLEVIEAARMSSREERMVALTAEN
jgi:predicted dehydrogenase